MRKFILVMLSLTSIFIFKNDVFALGLTKRDTGYYFTRYSSDGSRFSDKAYNYYIDGKLVYCIEPGKSVGDNYRIGSFTEMNYDADTVFKIKLAGFYGYGYPGHNTQEYIFATQAVIWHYILGTDYATFSTQLWGEGTKTNISNEINEIENLIKTSVWYASYHNKVIYMKIGQTLELSDTNNTIKDSYFRDNDVSIKNDKLIIKASKLGTKTVQITYMPKIRNESYVVYLTDGQAMYKPGDVATVSNLKLSVGPASIRLNVVDSSTGYPIEGVIYSFERKGSQEVEKFSTNRNGQLYYSFLYDDEYTISLSEVPEGYKFKSNIIVINTDGRDLSDLIKLDPIPVKEEENTKPDITDDNKDTNEDNINDEKNETIDEDKTTIESISNDSLVQTGESHKSLFLTLIFLLSIVLFKRKIITI